MRLVDLCPLGQEKRTARGSRAQLVLDRLVAHLYTDSNCLGRHLDVLAVIWIEI
jgi:hypothetical protein